MFDKDAVIISAQLSLFLQFNMRLGVLENSDVHAILSVLVKRFSLTFMSFNHQHITYMYMSYIGRWAQTSDVKITSPLLSRLRQTCIFTKATHHILKKEIYY